MEISLSQHFFDVKNQIFQVDSSIYVTSYTNSAETPGK